MLIIWVGRSTSTASDEREFLLVKILMAFQNWQVDKCYLKSVQNFV